MVNLGTESGKVIIKVVRRARAGQTLPLGANLGNGVAGAGGGGRVAPTDPLAPWQWVGWRVDMCGPSISTTCAHISPMGKDGSLATTSAGLSLENMKAVRTVQRPPPPLAVKTASRYYSCPTGG